LLPDLVADELVLGLRFLLVSVLGDVRLVRLLGVCAVGRRLWAGADLICAPFTQTGPALSSPATAPPCPMPSRLLSCLPRRCPRCTGGVKTARSPCCATARPRTIIPPSAWISCGTAACIRCWTL